MNEKLLDLANGEGNYLLGDTIYSKDGEMLDVIPKISEAEETPENEVRSDSIKEGESNCCGAPVYEGDRCSKCLENCSVETEIPENEDLEAEAEQENRIKDKQKYV